MAVRFSWSTGTSAPVVLTAVAAGIAFVLAPVAPASAAPGAQLVALAGATPPSPSSFGAKPQGPASESASTSFQVYFQPANTAQLAALATAVSTPGSGLVPPLPLRLAVRRSFRPERRRLCRLSINTCAPEGLSVGQLSANRLAQNVTGTSGQLEGAFARPLGAVPDRRRGRGRRLYVEPRSCRLTWPGRSPLWTASTPGLSRHSNLVRFARSAAQFRPDEGGPARGQPAAAGRPVTQGKRRAAPAMSQQGLTPAQLDSAYGLTGFDQRVYRARGRRSGSSSTPWPTPPCYSRLRSLHRGVPVHRLRPRQLALPPR